MGIRCPLRPPPRPPNPPTPLRPTQAQCPSHDAKSVQTAKLILQCCGKLAHFGRPHSPRSNRGLASWQGEPAGHSGRSQPASHSEPARPFQRSCNLANSTHRPSQWHPDRSRSIPRPRNCDPAHGSPPLRSLPSWRAPRPRLASPRCAMSDIVRNIEPVSRLAFQQMQRLPPSRIWAPLARLPTTLPAAVWQEHLRSPAACEPHNTLT